MKGDFAGQLKPQQHTSGFVWAKREEPVRLLLLADLYPQDAETGALSLFSEDVIRDAFGYWIEQILISYTELTATIFVCDARGNPLDVQRVAAGKRAEEGKRPVEGTALEAVRHALATGSCAVLPAAADDAEGEGGIAIAMPVVSPKGRTELVIGVSLPGSIGGDAGAEWLFSAGTALPPFLFCAVQKRRLAELSAACRQLEIEGKKREIRFQITQALQSKIEVEDVLTEMIGRVNELYPEAEVDLLMTQDHSSPSLPVKPLRSLHMEENVCTRAFLEGVLIVEKDLANGGVEVAVPLTGKQGVYGVLHLRAQDPGFDNSDIQLFKILAGAAGIAFENAKLYEQSNLLVNELRLINELTKRLNTSLKLNEIFHFASTELIQVFHADFCCILELDKNKQELIVQASNLPAMFHENFKSDYGFAGIVCATKEPIIVSDYWSNTVVRSKLMEITGSRSLIASPVLVNGQVEGVILVAHRLPNFFSYDNYKLLQVLSGHIGLAIANASLHAEVRRMAITDNLTGLYARHYLDEQIGLMQKKDFSGSLIVVDIDNFKSVNDTYGHQIGDQILIQVSSVIRTSIRDSDIAARWGGEELAIYLPQVGLEQAMRIAERIRFRVERETEPKVTVSCGVSEWSWQDEKISVEALFYRSDMALYKAKNEGKNQIQAG